MISTLYQGYSVTLTKTDTHITFRISNDALTCERSFNNDDCLEVTKQNLDFEGFYSTLSTILTSKPSDSILSINNEGLVTLTIKYKFGAILKEMKFDFTLDKVDQDPIKGLEKQVSELSTKMETRFLMIEQFMEKISNKFEAFEIAFRKIDERLDALEQKKEKVEKKGVDDLMFDKSLGCPGFFEFIDEKSVKKLDGGVHTNLYVKKPMKPGTVWTIWAVMDGLYENNQAAIIGVCTEKWLGDKAGYSNDGMYSWYSNQNFFINGNFDKPNFPIRNKAILAIRVDRKKETVSFIYEDEIKLTTAIKMDHKSLDFYFFISVRGRDNIISINRMEMEA